MTDTPNFSENPNWSPDGARIVFESDRVEKGDLEIYSMKADGSDVRRLTNSPALDALPAYSPDGKRIVFVSDRLQKDSNLFTMSSTGAKPKRVVAGEVPNFQMVPDWQPLRLGVREEGTCSAGPPLPTGGATDKVDPLYDQSDAWSMKMEPGITYRINLSPRKGCVSIGVYPPATRSFGFGRRVVFRECGGYFTVTPGPDRGGTTACSCQHLAAPRPSPSTTSGRQRRDRTTEGPGSAEQRREGHGIVVRHGHRRGRPLPLRCREAEHGPGSSGVLRRHQACSHAPGRKADRRHHSRVDAATTLKQGTYLLAVSAPGRIGGSYTLALLVRVVTKTTLTADGKARVTVPVGDTVVLRTETTPTPSGGTARLVLEYQDPSRVGLPPIVGREPGLERSVHASRRRRLACAGDVLQDERIHPSASHLVYVDATTAG